MVFSLPLIVMAITGFMLAIAPKSEGSKKIKSSPMLSVSQILDQQKKQHPESQFMRANFSEDSVMVMLRQKDVHVLRIDRVSGAVLSNTKPTDDIFILSKIIHESFLLHGPGKNIVAISGIALFIILITGFIYSLNRLRKIRGIRNMKEFHIVIGILFLLPLAFSAVSGTLIEYNNFFFSDQKQVAHERPSSCSWQEVLKVIDARAGKGGMIGFCRPDHPYVSISTREGFREYTPGNLEVLFVPKNDWDKQRGMRKHWFVHWHGGENFGPFEFTYQLMSSLPLLILIISGIIIWFRKQKRKTL